MDDLYPGGAKWLRRRLDDVERGKARARVVSCGDCLAGVSIETPKEERRIKLSTLWVRPELRRSGVGAALLREGRRRWLTGDAPRTDVTCATSAASELAPLLHAAGFSLQHVARDRYGEGRHELVFSWFPDANLPSAPRDARLLTTAKSQD